ncbi:MAG: DUF3137 domain-containing protein [Candidatus Izemoplasmatales bacterium]
MQNDFNQFNIKKKQIEKLSIIGWIVVGVGGIIAFALQNSAVMYVGFVALFVGFVIAMKATTDFKKLSNRFKDEVLVNMFKELMPGTVYNPYQGLSEYEVYGTEFLKRADRFYSEDYISGVLEDVKFISSDVRLEERHVEHTKNGTRTYYVPYFVGRVFKFSFNKEFDGYLQVLEAGSPLSNRGFKKVQLESIQFNKKFRTFTTDELSAFYVLTPDIIEAIIHLEERNPGRIGLSFTGDVLYIAINNNKDTFELKMYREIDNSLVEEFKQDLLVIKDVISAMKLNNRLFKK